MLLIVNLVTCFGLMRGLGFAERLDESQAAGQPAPAAAKVGDTFQSNSESTSFDQFLDQPYCQWCQSCRLDSIITLTVVHLQRCTGSMMAIFDYLILSLSLNRICSEVHLDRSPWASFALHLRDTVC